MADPWLTIIGIGEDAPEGLPPASRTAIEGAEIIAGAARHLDLIAGIGAGEQLVWPVPFADGIPLLLAHRGRRVVMLASGDPFWFGAGAVLARHLEPAEWRVLPAPSSFSLAAARMGWGIEGVTCLGLHAAPLARLRPHLAPGARLIVLLRDGAAVAELAALLVARGFGDSDLTVMECLGGPRERVRHTRAADYALDAAHPVAVAVRVAGDGAVMPRVSGLPDDLFDHDGQITKRPVRALTLSALAPRPGELLWDIGAGSGSVGIEWLLTHPSTRAIGFEADPARAARARANADALGVDRLEIRQGRAPEVLDGAPDPDAVFIGGGLSAALLARLTALRPGTRIVANAVTLESETLLVQAQAAYGGALLRVDMAEAAPLGRLRGWRASYPIVQWSVVL
ncbi:MAG: precorrin-6y C5,15-methyltransferase (decarboxylating) subunit CbiE [Paracoccus sp. (in: a-proteobacteria)]|uniref:precorrin-6y C5,15-methyltransferase (decarboxylating) subunit CbiE n=1 Tax=Paracoccus sp. TaxID=267 RepID=UPI0026E0F81C|nr:precorrin-6y C5,15-methyltransferase (decarboxylating) subunit CbiE [Paracoccus sp. (in: a-proteobacteria)]MDO5631835.1 precorrin-6y C5,15-methyltransferase (decarboxylating) subunit CbiE [Paracoccus sp. (in: a-proteobacteria)]